VGKGWVTLLPPLPPGTHKVTIRNTGTDWNGDPVDITTTTTIVVGRRR
jgi:hypothetical protein